MFDALLLRTWAEELNKERTFTWLSIYFAGENARLPFLLLPECVGDPAGSPGIAGDPADPERSQGDP